MTWESETYFSPQFQSSNSDCSLLTLSHRRCLNEKAYCGSLSVPSIIGTGWYRKRPEKNECKLSPGNLLFTPSSRIAGQVRTVDRRGLGLDDTWGQCGQWLRYNAAFGGITQHRRCFKWNACRGSSSGPSRLVGIGMYRNDRRDECNCLPAIYSFTPLLEIAGQVRTSGSSRGSALTTLRQLWQWLRLQCRFGRHHSATQVV